MTRDGWAGLFANAFKQSRNPMVLVDGERRIRDANGAFVQVLGQPRDALLGRTLFSFLAGGPLVTPTEWRAALAERRFTGKATLLDADGREVDVQFAGSTETVTGQQLVLFVVLSTSRWGAHFRRATIRVRRRSRSRDGPPVPCRPGLAHRRAGVGLGVQVR